MSNRSFDFRRVDALVRRALPLIDAGADDADLEIYLANVVPVEEISDEEFAVAIERLGL